MQCFVSCNQNENKFNISVSNESIEVTTISGNKDNRISLRRVNAPEIKNINIISGKTEDIYLDKLTYHFSENFVIDVKELLKSTGHPYDIALELIESGNICYEISINSTKDTLIYLTPMFVKETTLPSSVSLVNGACAKLLPLSNPMGDIMQIKEWLYDHKLHKSDSLVSKMSDIVADLYDSSRIEYATTEEIPIIKDFTNIIYKFITDARYDYYYLFATSSQNELDEFIKDVCISNFEGGEKNLTRGLSCYRKKDKGGILCLFFIGLNNDWSKFVTPVGLVAVDNIRPDVYSDNNMKTQMFRDDGSSILDTKDKGTKSYQIDSAIINIPSNAPNIDGQLLLITKPFRGDHANFEVRFGGDIKSISIKREIHRRKYTLKPETKTILLENLATPYYFTYELDLGIGDNYIPIQVTDKMGNKTEFTYNISMVSVEDNSPQINIDNNIDIWN